MSTIMRSAKAIKSKGKRELLRKQSKRTEKHIEHSHPTSSAKKSSKKTCQQ